MRQHANAAVSCQPVDARAVPQIVVSRWTGYFALVVRPALVRIGEIEAAVRMADHVVRPVEASALVVVDQRLDLAIRAHSGQAAVIAFADDQPALQVEGGAIAADRRPDQLRLLAGGQAKQLVPAKIDEIPPVVRMPERTLGKDEAGREALRVR